MGQAISRRRLWVLRAALVLNAPLLALLGVWLGIYCSFSFKPKGFVFFWREAWALMGRGWRSGNTKVEEFSGEKLAELQARRKEAVEKLRFWKKGDSSFTSRLYTLISTADRMNRAKLMLAFTTEVLVFVEWENTSPEEKFWEKYK